MHACARAMDGWMDANGCVDVREREGDRRDGRSSARERGTGTAIDRDGGDRSRSVADVSSSLCLGTTGKDDDDDDDDDDEDDEDDDDDEDEGEAWTVETGRADDGGVARGGTRRAERDRFARAERDRFARAAFELVTETIEIADGCAVRLVRPKSEDEVVEHYVAAGTLDSDPYWAALCPSADVRVEVSREGAERWRSGRACATWGVG